ncbi:16S rRNA (cytidine1402-2'-O)-methyltransferase [Spiroplasma gladiatoris]|uniref:16S rRNA (Cytidine1402-2'-O)-methyltransferase n=1 Tax=Spiroplasma gladiatoris TaxID=2143 RepID=A0A4V1AQ70_9MOLU|nr:16S rRNA (cytidine(1402)-2'-O)-methyltransferase [Spiroplasma gladiatoris]QBQ07469.1 16S rRNA (cytidine1402-2'-O)-methyltransferase [Spiroplasma gladiatoris]
MKIQKTFKDNFPIIYIVGTPIGNINDFSFRAIDILNKVEVIYCEDTRTSHVLLKNYQIQNNLSSLHKYNEVFKSQQIENDLINNKSIAIISDAGVPCISDPGSKLLNSLLEKEINFSISAINCGPAYIHALVMSGFETKKNIFIGFLDKRIENIKAEIETIFTNNKDTVICFYESVHRIVNTINVLKNILDKNTKIVIIREISKINEEIIRGNIEEIFFYINSKDFVQKGEFVVVIDKNSFKKAEKLNSNELVTKVKELINEGISKKEAIKIIAKNQGVNKTDLYSIIHKKNK